MKPGFKRLHMKILLLCLNAFETIEFSSFVDVMSWAHDDFGCDVEIDICGWLHPSVWPLSHWQKAAFWRAGKQPPAICAEAVKGRNWRSPALFREMNGLLSMTISSPPPAWKPFPMLHSGYWKYLQQKKKPIGSLRPWAFNRTVWEEKRNENTIGFHVPKCCRILQQRRLLPDLFTGNGIDEHYFLIAVCFAIVLVPLGRLRIVIL